MIAWAPVFQRISTLANIQVSPLSRSALELLSRFLVVKFSQLCKGRDSISDPYWQWNPNACIKLNENYWDHKKVESMPKAVLVISVISETNNF